MRITVLGMGSMGRAFASRAIDRGHVVTVWNRSHGKAAELVRRGATEADSVRAAVADAEVTLVVLADDQASRAVCLGDDGALAALADGAVLANVSTVSPDTARELATAGPPDAVVDAPVLGAPAAIAGGHGRFLIGGPADTVDGLAALWADLGAGYTYCGPAGSGAVLKLLSNLQLMIGLAALAEAMATARRHGIPDDLLRTVFGDSPVVSRAATMRLDSLLSADHPGWFTPELAAKDVRLAVALAGQRDVPVLLGPATEELLTRVVGAGWPDLSAVIEGLTER
jgi:3-hydroxyisobutyrate dehydrogenase